MNHPVARPRRAVKATTALACGIAGLVLTAGPVAAAGRTGGGLPEPEAHGNLSASVSVGDLVPGCEKELTIDVNAWLELLATGSHSEGAGGLEVTIAGVRIDGEGMATFDFTSNLPIHAVLVKAGKAGELYKFGEAVTSAEALVSAAASISHISFCAPDVPTPDLPDVPTPDIPDVPTPDLPDVPVPDVPDVPGDGDTTTTTAGSSTTATPSTTASPSTSTSDEDLAKTGSNSTMMLVGVGSVLLAAGTALVLGTRRLWRRTI